MKDYQPNFSHKKIIDRFTTAIEFVEKYVGSTPVPVSKSQIVKFFGQAQKASSRYLKEHLLICTDEYFNWNTGVCKKYIRNEQGLFELKRKLGISQVTPELQNQLDSGQFVLTEKSDRFFNPLQYKPKRIQRPIMAANGYNYNYDIECAAPTLLYQYAKKIAATSGKWVELPFIEAYLNDRTLIREHLSITHNLSSDTIKTVITSLFQGAQLGMNNKTRLYHLLNGNFYVIQKLKTDDYLKELMNELKYMWSIITPEMKQQLNKKRIVGRDKAAKYRELEKEVMSVIKKELKRTNNLHLPIHDGWISRDVCDVIELINCVRSQTGYVIKIDWEIWE